MKRNKHNNVIKTVASATTNSDRIVAERESTELIMKAADGSLVKAEGVKLSPTFVELSQKLMKEKGVSKESAEALAKSAVIWTPDMIGKDIDAEEAPKPEKKKRAPRKKATEEEKPKKTTRKKTVEAPIEKKPEKSKKTTRKKKTSETK